MWRSSTATDVFFTIASTIVAIGSLVLVVAAMRHLGRRWAIEARTIEHHELITTGPYRFVRHPIYVGVGGFVVATGLLFAPATVLLAACLAYIIGTNIRVHAEDALMAATFGPEFDEYRRRVPALIPRFRAA
jgi:protein-S-isoprenylcysteine O-methyltransferase Ste14